jgi:hypothetical protein
MLDICLTFIIVNNAAVQTSCHSITFAVVLVLCAVLCPQLGPHALAEVACLARCSIATIMLTA